MSFQNSHEFVFGILLQLLLLTAGCQAQPGCSTACIQNGGKCVQEYDSAAYRCDCTGTGSNQVDCANNATAPIASTNTSSTPPTSSAGQYNCPVACYHGQCLQQENSNSYYCKCEAGYQEPSCQNLTASAASPPSSPTNTSGSFTCPVPCENGQCVQDYDSQSYSCSCSPGYSGNSCNIRASAPSASPPSSSQTPSTPSGTYTCPVACDNGQCLQQENSNSYYCKCNSGYTGNSCSQTNGPAASAPSSTNCTWCKNGICRPIANSRSEYYCDCASGYSNWDCSTVVAATQSSSESTDEHGARTLRGWKIFVIVLACMVGVVLAASAAYIVYRRRRSPKTFVKFRDNEMGAQEPQEIEIRRNVSK